MEDNSFYISLDSENFRREVLHCEQLVLVEFSAKWCGLSQIIAPVMEEMAERFRTQVKFCRIDVDRAGDVAERYGILRIPALLFFKDGQVLDYVMGAASRKMIGEKIQALLKKKHDLLFFKFNNY